jgi:hypothetical protein
LARFLLAGGLGMNFARPGERPGEEKKPLPAERGEKQVKALKLIR